MINKVEKKKNQNLARPRDRGAFFQKYLGIKYYKFFFIGVIFVFPMGLSKLNLFKKFFSDESRAMVGFEEKAPKTKKISLRSFLVNLEIENEKRTIVKVDVDVEILDLTHEKEIEKNKTRMRRIIFSILSGKTYAQISSNHERSRIEDELKKQVNLFLSKEFVCRIHFRQKILNASELNAHILQKENLIMRHSMVAGTDLFSEENFLTK